MNEKTMDELRKVWRIASPEKPLLIGHRLNSSTIEEICHQIILQTMSVQIKHS